VLLYLLQVLFDVVVDDEGGGGGGDEEEKKRRRRMIMMSLYFPVAAIAFKRSHLRRLLAGKYVLFVCFIGFYDTTIQALWLRSSFAGERRPFHALFQTRTGT
jgi:hypothetical protein